MKQNRGLVRVARVGLNLALVLAAACGGERAPEAEAVPYIPPGPPVRDTMSQATLKGIDPSELGLALPWTSGKLNRQPPPGAPSRTIAGVELSSEEGFDRFLIQFESDAREFPGYNLEWVTSVEDCAASPAEVAYETSGSAFLRLRISGARGHGDDGRGTTGRKIRKGESPNLKQLLQTCDFEGRVTWVFDLDATTPYRVMELDDPARLVVDVQHPAATPTGA